MCNVLGCTKHNRVSTYYCQGMNTKSAECRPWRTIQPDSVQFHINGGDTVSHKTTVAGGVANRLNGSSDSRETISSRC